MSVGFLSHGVGRTLCFSLFPFSRLYSFWLWRRTSDGGRPTLSSGGGGLFNTVYRQLLSLAPLLFSPVLGGRLWICVRSWFMFCAILLPSMFDFVLQMRSRYGLIEALCWRGYDSEEGRDGCGFKVASGGLGGFGWDHGIVSMKFSVGKIVGDVGGCGGSGSGMIRRNTCSFSSRLAWAS